MYTNYLRKDLYIENFFLLKIVEINDQFGSTEQYKIIIL